MDNAKLIEALERAVNEAEEELRRRKEALAALKGKTATGKARVISRRRFRQGGLPGLVFVVLKDFNQPMTTAEIVSALKKHNKVATTREVSVAIDRYVRQGRGFRVTEEGKYALIE